MGLPATSAVEEAGLAPAAEVELGIGLLLLLSSAALAEDAIALAVREVFGLTPKEIIQGLDLLRPIYQSTAAYGHFGREEKAFTWERTDKKDELRAAVGSKGKRK